MRPVGEFRKIWAVATGSGFALIASGLVIGGLVTGCGDGQRPVARAPARDQAIETAHVLEPGDAAPPGMDASPLESTNVLRSFLAQGVVRELPADGRSVVVRHEAIPGFMPKMTMSFNVREPKELQGLRPGDAIRFRLKATDEDSWIEDIQRSTGNEVGAAPAPDPSSLALLQADRLKPGEMFPDAELLSEDGRPIRLSDFSGQALAFTFIFTRCPLPDYCPRMNLHFSRARELLVQRPAGATNWQFLSISFDPGFDRPGVLKRYAYSYRGPSSDRWLFAVAPTNVLAAFANQLDFRFADDQGSFVHNLRTVVLDRQRRIYRQFDGNKWKANELADALAEAAAVR